MHQKYQYSVQCWSWISYFGKNNLWADVGSFSAKHLTSVIIYVVIIRLVYITIKQLKNLVTKSCFRIRISLKVTSNAWPIKFMPCYINHLLMKSSYFYQSYGLVRQLCCLPFQSNFCTLGKFIKSLHFTHYHASKTCWFSHPLSEIFLFHLTTKLCNI